MSEPRKTRIPSLETLAIRDHERGCRNEPPWPHLTISHRHVHDANALRERRRLEEAVSR